jgi:hypothetical protein
MQASAGWPARGQAGRVFVVPLCICTNAKTKKRKGPLPSKGHIGGKLMKGRTFINKISVSYRQHKDPRGLQDTGDVPTSILRYDQVLR